MLRTTLIILLFSPLFVFSQNINPEINGITLAPLTTTGKKIEGDSYFTSDWTEGTVVVSTDNKEIPLNKLKYDILEDKLIFQNAVGVFEFPKGSVYRFTLNIYNEKTARFQKYKFIAGLDGISKYTPASFFEVIYEGDKVKFLKKTYAELRKAASASYGSHTEEYVYVRQEEWYIYNQGKAVAVKKNKKSILEALGGDTKEWEKFIKDNQLNLKKDDDIVALLKYYETKA